jgi:hypothetical protein
VSLSPKVLLPQHFTLPPSTMQECEARLPEGAAAGQAGSGRDFTAMIDAPVKHALSGYLLFSLAVQACDCRSILAFLNLENRLFRRFCKATCDMQCGTGTCMIVFWNK